MGTASSIQNIKYKDQQLSSCQDTSQDSSLDTRHNIDDSKAESIFFFMNNQYDIGETLFHNLNNSFI